MDKVKCISHFVFIARESSIKENRFINSGTVVVTKTVKTCFTHIFSRSEIGRKTEMKTSHVSLTGVDLHFKESVCQTPYPTASKYFQSNIQQIPYSTSL